MKFKVGDEVRIIDKGNSVNDIGDIGIVSEVSFSEKSVRVKVDGKPNIGNWSLNEKIELVKRKPSKNERIKLLEETVTKQGEEINKLKLIITKLCETSNLVKEELVKSNNQLRADVIEKAKKFVNEKLSQVDLRVKDSRPGYSDWFIDKFEFVINENKKTVVVLCKGLKLNVLETFKSKCMPGDVFNEHIGKAIALGRALNLDVSEFENCVQPNELVIGHEFRHKLETHKIISGTVLKFDKINKSVYGGRSFRHTYDNGWLCDSRVNILDDTNAKYEVK